MFACHPTVRPRTLFAWVFAAAFLPTFVAPATSRGQRWDDPVKIPGGAYALYEPPLLVRWFVPPPYPVVVYLHGAFEQNETKYEPLLEDLARDGYVVVYPRFNAQLVSNWSQWYAEARDITRGALYDLRVGRVGTTRADTSQLALVGHSTGGMFSLKMAHESVRLGIAPPRTIVLHDAAAFTFLPFLGLPTTWLDDLSGIPSYTRIVVLAAEDTWYAEIAEALDGDAVGLGNSNAAGVWSRAWHATARVPGDRKHAYIVPGGHNGMQIDYWEFGEPYREITLDALQSAFEGGAFPLYHENAYDVGWALQYYFLPTPYAGF